jgi:hypothetical protein
MNTYLVTLADRNTGEDQRILVQSKNDEDMQAFVESDEVRPTLRLTDPVVIAIHQLKIKRPVLKVTMPSLIRG